MFNFKNKIKYRYLILPIILIFLLTGFVSSQNGFSFSRDTTSINFFKSFFGILKEEKITEEYKDENRINFLILGIRGENDENGGLLTDTIIILSANKETGKTALISIPRDTYIEMPEYGLKSKINDAYAIGGTELIKKAVEKISGIYIDNTAVIDFNGFKNIIDALGGITIKLDHPFTESKQWGGGGDLGSDKNFITNEEGLSFYLPAGENHIDGLAALYYARSRYTSNDFERSKRQQQILIAIKDKIQTSNLSNSPFKFIKILNIISNNVKTDMDFTNISDLLFIYNNLNFKEIKKQTFDASSGILYSSHGANGSYILLPTNGNFNQIKKICREILN